MKQTNEVKDENMSDTFLTNFLQYRNQLVDHDFIKKIMKKIDRFQTIRQLIIFTCSLIGIISFVSVLSLDWMTGLDLAFSELSSMTTNLPTESITAVVLSAIAILGFWLVIEDC